MNATNRFLQKAKHIEAFTYTLLDNKTVCSEPKKKKKTRKYSCIWKSRRSYIYFVNNM